MYSTNKMSHLHKADLCVNHTMAVNLGFMLGDDEEDRVVTSTYGPSKIFTKFLSYIKKPKPDEKGVESFFANGLRGHSCTISSVVNNSKRFVWWRNPWGAYADWSRWDRLGNSYDLPEGCNDLYDKIRAGKIEDVKENVSASDQKPLPEHVKIQAIGDRLGNMLGESRNRGEAEVHRANEICRKLDEWAVDSYGDDPLPDGHVMKTLQLLKLMTNAEHLVVIHPFRSMPWSGPQTDDGIDCDTTSVTGRVGGACVLWGKVYMKRVQEVMEEFLAKRKPLRTEPELLELVTKVLTTDNLGGEVHVTQALANYMDSNGEELKAWKTILSIVYDMMPEKREQRVTRHSTSTRFNSDWHVETLWKLSLVVKYIEDKLIKDRKRVNPKDLLPEFVAGYIESIYIVASEEARAHPAYSETVGHIATFVVKHRLHNARFLRQFVRMVKFLMSCKHNEGIQDNADAERRKFELPTQTRADRDKGKTFLIEHAALYGYGASNGSDFVEDARRKRRRTGSYAMVV